MRKDNMNGVFLLNYAVRGIKNIDKLINLSFYKKTIDKKFTVNGYNLKGIYGANGAGKTGIVASVRILKRLLTEQNYLSNTLIQNELHELINRKTKELEINVEYLLSIKESIFLFNYEIKLVQTSTGQYEIEKESLIHKKKSSHSYSPTLCFETVRGRLTTNYVEEYSDILTDQTKNLLTNSTLASIIINKDELFRSESANNSELWKNIVSLILLGSNLFVCSDQGDDHTSFHMNNYFDSDRVLDINNIDLFAKEMRKLSGSNTGAFTIEPIAVEKNNYNTFKRRVNSLFEFLRVFKDDLVSVDIDRKENGRNYICSLVLNYGEYSVNAEFESTGIKKLIKLYDYLDKMVHGKIVFIDELDSNLHDVYLCALLEYLMENANGQLCFTTHNVGPMDILKKNKKSIDFLSTEHVIYPWVTNGNYSPANLYKKGMIEGSPFNVFPFDFIKAFFAEGDNK